MASSQSAKTERLLGLAEHLHEVKGIDYVRCIPTAKIPILKISAFGFGMNVSVGSTGVLAAAEFLLREQVLHPLLRPLVVALKGIFKTSGFLNTYHGGLSSHTISGLSIAFFQVWSVVLENSVTC